MFDCVVFVAGSSAYGLEQQFASSHDGDRLGRQIVAVLVSALSPSAVESCSRIS